MSPADVAAHIRSLEEARRQALEAGDVDRNAALLSEDLVYVHSGGQIDNRASYLAMQEHVRFRRVARPKIDVRLYGDVAVTTGLVELSAESLANGQTFDLQAFYTHVWVNESGGWKLVNVQGTPVP